MRFEIAFGEKKSCLGIRQTKPPPPAPEREADDSRVETRLEPLVPRGPLSEAGAREAPGPWLPLAPGGGKLEFMKINEGIVYLNK